MAKSYPVSTLELSQAEFDDLSSLKPGVIYVVGDAHYMAGPNGEKVQRGAGGGGAGAVSVPYSTTIPLDGNKWMPRTQIAGAVAFVVGAVTPGGSCKVGIVANGTNVPTYSGFTLDPNSDSFTNTNGRLHNYYFFNDGDINWLMIRDTGLTVGVAATSLSASGPTTGVVNTASTTITVTANGSLAAPVTVTPSANVAGSFSPASASLTNGGSVTFTFTPTATGSATLTFAATGLTSATLAYTVTAAATAPAQVTGLTLGTATSTTQPLTWTAPSNGGSAITDYVVQYAVAGSGSWTTFADGTSTTTSATVTGLTASTSYDFRVAAVNAVGTGSYSATATGSTAAAGGGGAGTVVRLVNTSGLTETGNATDGWNYASTTVGAVYANGTNGTSALAVTADGYMEYTIGGDPLSGFGAWFGLTTSQTLSSYGGAVGGIYIDTTNYRATTAGTGGQIPNGTAVTAAVGDILRIERVGTTMYARVSKDNRATWTTIHTWTGVTTVPLYALAMSTKAYAQITNIRGGGVA